MGDKTPKPSLKYFLITIVIVVFDQISKLLVIGNLKENESFSVIGDFFYIHFIYNKGGAWGTSIGPSWVYTILTLAALVLIIRYFMTSKSYEPLTKISLAVILGGAVGNLIDRIFYGKVVDFIDIDIPDIHFLGIQRWFTFNIADAAITIGLILFGLSVIFKKNIQGNPIDQPELLESDPPKT